MQVTSKSIVVSITILRGIAIPKSIVRSVIPASTKSVLFDRIEVSPNTSLYMRCLFLPALILLVTISFVSRIASTYLQVIADRE